MASVILITGGTGLFGSTLIEHFLKNEPDTKIFALVRAASAQKARERLFTQIRNSPTFSSALDELLHKHVQAISGDFTRDTLEIPDTIRSELQQSVTDIIHSGASVDFGLPLAEARVINVTGTRNMLEFARQCKKLNVFVHISTGHVAGKWSGIIRENDLATDQGFFNSYEQTKAESEQLVHTYMDTIPITIHRLTTVIGDYTTGHIRQFGFFHNSVRLLSQGMIPFLAGNKSGHLDLIPTEYPVRAVYHLHRHNFQPGTTYHICAGPERSFTLDEFLQETVDHLKHVQNNTSLKPPDIISREEFDDRIKQSGTSRTTAILGALNTFIGHLTLPKVFDQTNAVRDLTGSGIDAPLIRSYYTKVLDECVRRKFGKI